MTEQEWLECNDPRRIYGELFYHAPSDRKQRLFNVACCRRIWHLFSDERSRRAVEVAERFADACATEEELEMASAAACDVWERERASSGSEKADKDDDSLPYGAAFAAYNVALPVGWWGGAPAFVAPHQIVCEVTSNREFEREAQCLLIRDIFGNPFRPVDAAWLKRRQGKVPKIAQRIYDARAFADLPILADALEEAGCTNAELLAHCRHPGPHVRGCWAVDLILGKS